MEKEATCKERLLENYQGRMSDLRQLWAAYTSQQFDVAETGDDPLDNPEGIYEYGLSFDYVAPGTFEGQKRGYWRYQISWGGPSDEFRFYCDENRNPERIQYHFMDWWDGAKRTLRRGADFDFLCELWEWFKAAGSVDHVYAEAMKD